MVLVTIIANEIETNLQTSAPRLLIFPAKLLRERQIRLPVLRPLPMYLEADPFVQTESPPWPLDDRQPKDQCQVRRIRG